MGIHRESTLSIILFPIVLENLTRQIKTAPWDMRFMDDVAIITKTRGKTDRILKGWSH
jgi:hypothetical protein